MTEYGSLEQTKRRRRKHGVMTIYVDCGCLTAPFSPCEHNAEWRQRNIRLLNIRKPLLATSLPREVVQREVER